MIAFRLWRILRTDRRHATKMQDSTTGGRWKIEFGDGTVLEASSFEELVMLVDGRPDLPLRVVRLENALILVDGQPHPAIGY